MFRPAGAAGVAGHEEWATDAAAWAATREGERLKVLAAQAARTMSRAGRTLFTSEQPVSLAAEYRTGEVNLSLYADVPTTVRLYLGSAPAAFRLDGAEAPAGGMKFNRADGTVSFVAPAGEHRLSFSLR
jgi:hypothetical protein